MNLIFSACKHTTLTVPAYLGRELVAAQFTETDLIANTDSPLPFEPPLPSNPYTAKSSIMTTPASRDANHPLAKPNLSLLRLLQAQGQTVGSRGYHMQITNFFHWGFVIYRCNYSNDDLFNIFIAYLREEAECYHQRAKQDRTTGLYLRWTIVEDIERLDSETKDEVRERFVGWRGWTFG